MQLLLKLTEENARLKAAIEYVLIEAEKLRENDRLYIDIDTLEKMFKSKDIDVMEV
jgi:hypothetical protein